MNKGLIFVIGMGIGGLIGAASTYFYMKKEIDKAVEETVEDFKANYNLNEKYPTIDIPEEGEMVAGDGSSVPPTHTRSSLSSKPMEGVLKMQYDKLSSLYNKPDPEFIVGADLSQVEDISVVREKVEDILLQDEHPQDGDEEDIRLVTLDEFMTSEHQAVDLIWYLGDNTLVDEETDQEVENWAPLVGDVLDNIEVNPAVDNAIYIRNDISGVDFNVVVVDGRWIDQKE